MVAHVGKERSDLGRGLRSVVVCKFGQGQKGAPIGLLVVNIALEILFKDGISSSCLSISLWSIGC